MDSVVKVRRSFLNDIRAFCNSFAGLCEGCFMKPCNCPNVDIISRAKHLIMRIDNIRDAEEERYFIDNPNEEMFARIIRAIEQAGRPVRSEEIRLEGVYRQRKAWALKHMVRHGRLEMSIENNVPFYSVGIYGNATTQQHKKGN